MDSIGKMIKTMPNNGLLERAEQAFQQLLKESAVLRLRQANPELAEEQLRLHMNTLYQVVRDERNCTHCPGLDRCPNDYAGHRTSLTSFVRDGVSELAETRAACDLWNTRQFEQQLRSRIRSFHVDEPALQQGYSASEILSADLERAKAVSEIIKYILRTQEQGLQTRGLFLSGPFGTGKTFLLCYMIHELAKSGYTGAVVYMPDFVEDVKAMIQEPNRLRETMEWLKNTDLLVFDDLGAENLNPWFRDHVFGALLNDRMGRKPTFFTSNFELDSMLPHFSFTNKEGDEEHKGLRLMERIKHYVDRVFVGGSNKRGL
jgi:primosomal protein DnaI